MKNKTKKADVGLKTEATAVAELAAETAALPGERAARSSGEFKTIARGLIRPDPNQPRKEFSEAQLKEMAQSIYLQGLIQPLVVKAVPAELVIHEPDLHLKTWQATDPKGAVVFEGSEDDVRRFAEGKTTDYFQLIAGERRWRSTVPQALEIDGKQIEWAGLKELPCMVRVADERDTFALQHIENLQRANLSALEEAQSFGNELAKRRAADPAFTAERLGEELGIKRGTVFNLMKLLRLKEPVRLALVAGKIETSHARAIAQVPDVKRQEELLVRAQEDAHYNEPLMSVRALEELIDDEYVKQLKDAPFDKEDENLLRVTWCVRAGQNEMVLECPKKPQIPNLWTIGTPKLHPSSASAEYGKFYITSADNFDIAGPLPKKDARAFTEFLAANLKAGQAVVSQASGWACVTCPHRSGVMDPTTKTPNVCSLPSCFDAKVKAHWVKKSEELKAKGTAVLTEGELRKKGKHIPADKHEYTQNKSGTFQELMGKHAPEPVLVATKEGIKKFYPAEEAVAAAKKNGVKFYTQGKPVTAADAEKAKLEKEQQEKAKVRREELVNEQLENLAAGIAKLKDLEAWDLVKELMPDGWTDPRKEKALTKPAKTVRAEVIGKLLSEDDQHPIEHSGDWDKKIIKFWKQLGVDLEALDKEAEKAAQPKLPLAKAEPQQKALLEVKQKGPKKMTPAKRALIAAAAKARWAKVKALGSKH